MKDWEEVASKNGSLSLETGTRDQGISISIGKTKGTLYVSGWYDSVVGIQGAELPLRSLLELFPKAALQKAVKGLL